ncbi:MULTISPECIES: TauD/TfdA family dioxygenase [unclassified Leptolyngbya]|uniref:TauD/TfdA family dioxygenase n=1 Tax=unclassified Leptolyngbya TaxID=2650499 RepID=UPI001682306B|nr:MULTISPECIES: TauD/TfdA family dioxygenase [unclassified Leptolyngbya]MBD1910482.1 TauD/TfdA family dioxygenase [Leptolyngbya sp. FACHB-8]MBD2153649.1 TauD/TfdA family dioxygenase [Leptolyngbya sp. FACHB-16]
MQQAIASPTSVTPDVQIIDCSSFDETTMNLFLAPGPNPYKDTEEFLLDCEMRADEMPRFVRRMLLEFQVRSNPEGILLIRGLPIDPGLYRTPTPSDGLRSASKTTYVSERCLSMIGSRLGHLVSYIQEKNGDLFQNLVPVQGNERVQASSGSQIRLQFHRETVFHPYPPEFLLLFCLRPDHDRLAETTYASITHALPLLSDTHKDLLFQPLYRTGVDYSFGNIQSDKTNGKVLPVLYGNRNDPFLNYDEDLMEAMTPEAQEALEALKAAIASVYRGVKLGVGDLLCIDNRRTAHGRSSFVPRYDGFDRWLQRSFVVRDLGLSAVDRKGDRIIRTAFN